MTLKNIPKHVAIIMDGNGRWAKAQGLHRIEGHKKGVDVSELIIDKSAEIGLEYLTLYAFSRENWNRPNAEVQALMQLLKYFLESKREKMLKNGIRLRAIGNLDLLPTDVRQILESTIRETSIGKGMTLILALSYGSRDELIRAVKQLVHQCENGELVLSDIDESVFSDFLDTKGIPDPELIIRTSGEHRLSNFLLWQAAYAEFVFEECLWPDFTPEHLLKALRDFQTRERRFGKTSEQLKGGE